MSKQKSRFFYWFFLILTSATTFVGVFITVIGFRTKRWLWVVAGALYLFFDFYTAYCEYYGLFLIFWVVSILHAIMIRKKYFKLLQAKNEINELKKELNPIQLTVRPQDIISGKQAKKKSEAEKKVTNFQKNTKTLLAMQRINWGYLSNETNKQYKDAYYTVLSNFADRLLLSTNEIQQIKEIACNHLGLAESDKEYEYEEALSILKKSEIKRISLFKWKRYNYLIPLGLELSFMKFIINDFKISTDEIDLVLLQLGLQIEDISMLRTLIHLLLVENEFDKAKIFIYQLNKVVLKEQLIPLVEHIIWQFNYHNSPEVNVAVVATMSSGKSTLINALLGDDLIPSKNEACTAKVTSIYDNDHLNRLIGYCGYTSGKLQFKSNIVLKDLEQWNSKESIKKIVLEKDFEGVKSKKGTLVISDTPGTNYSQDDSHEESTFDFLNKNNIDVLLFVINACNIQAMDNDLLLRRIKQEVIDQKETKIIFLLNKIDNFDYEKEDDIKSSIVSINEHLNEIGYKHNIIIPISGYAGYLFKKALADKEFSKKESFDFISMYSMFFDDDINLEHYALNLEGTYVFNTKPWGDDCHIHNKTYKKANIKKALSNSGLLHVEYILEEMLN